MQRNIYSMQQLYNGTFKPDCIFPSYSKAMYFIAVKKMNVMVRPCSWHACRGLQLLLRYPLIVGRNLREELTQ